MSSRVVALARMQLFGLFGLNRLLHSEGGAERKKAAVLCAIAVCVAALAFALSTSISYELAVAGLAGALPAIAVLLCTLVMLMLTFLKSSGVLAGADDYDIVMSLPVTPAQVVVSRVAAVYFADALICAIVIVPASVVLAVQGATGAAGIVFLLASCLAIPVIPMVVALTLGTVVTLVSVHSRRSNVLSLVLSTILVLVTVAATGALNQASGDDIAAATSTLAAIFQTAWLPATLIVQSASGDALSFLLFLALSAAVAGIFIVFAARFYRRMNNVHPRRRATTFSLGDLKVRSPFRAMCRRELSRYFSCTIYALNSSIGMVLLLAFSVLLAFGGANAITAYAGEVDVGSMLRAALPLILAMFVSITCTTSASLSLEGRSRWIMCSLPVRSIDVFRSKMAVNLSVIAPFTLASVVLLAIAMCVSGLGLALMLVVPTAYACFISTLGMYMNVRFPRYDWTSEYYAVKGGAISVLATTGLGVLCSVVPLGICLGLPQYGEPVMVMVAVILLLTAAVLYHRLELVRLYES